MKFSYAFILAALVVIFGSFSAPVYARKHGSNIILKDGHLILSSGEDRRGGENIVIKEDHHKCHCGWW